MRAFAEKLRPLPRAWPAATSGNLQLGATGYWMMKMEMGMI